MMDIFSYQPTFNVPGLKTDKGTEYIISWKSKGAFLPYILEI